MNRGDNKSTTRNARRNYYRPREQEPVFCTQNPKTARKVSMEKDSPVLSYGEAYASLFRVRTRVEAGKNRQPVAERQHKLCLNPEQTVLVTNALLREHVRTPDLRTEIAPLLGFVIHGQEGTLEQFRSFAELVRKRAYLRVVCSMRTSQDPEDDADVAAFTRLLGAIQLAQEEK